METLEVICKMCSRHCKLGDVTYSTCEIRTGAQAVVDGAEQTAEPAAE